MFKHPFLSLLFLGATFAWTAPTMAVVCLIGLDKASVVGSPEINANCDLHSNGFVEVKGNPVINVPAVSMPDIGDVVVKGNVDISQLLRNGLIRIREVETPVPGSCDFQDLEVYTDQTLYPGTYCGGIHVYSANISLAPGEYVLVDGDFKVRGDANITSLANDVPGESNDVSMYLVGSEGNIAGNLSWIGNINVDLPGPADARADIVQQVEQGNANGQKAANEMHVTNLDYDGLVFMQSEGLSVKNDNAGQTTGCFLFIGQTLSLTGNANLDIDQDAGCSPFGF